MRLLFAPLGHARIAKRSVAGWVFARDFSVFVAFVIFPYCPKSNWAARPFHVPFRIFDCA
jgi:hypothetical protein